MKSIVICDSTLVDKEDAEVLKNNGSENVNEIVEVNKNVDQNFSSLIKSGKHVLHKEDSQSIEISHLNSKINEDIKNIEKNSSSSINVSNLNEDINRNGQQKLVVTNSSEAEMCDENGLEKGINLEEEVEILSGQTNENKINCESKAEMFAEEAKNSQSISIKLKLDLKPEMSENIDGKCSKSKTIDESLFEKTLLNSEENKENELTEAESNKKEVLRKDSEPDVWSQDCQIVEETEKTKLEDASKKIKENISDISSSNSISIKKIDDVISDKGELISEKEESKKQDDSAPIVLESEENEEIMECDTEGSSAADGEAEVSTQKEELKSPPEIVEDVVKDNTMENEKINSTNARKRHISMNGADDPSGGKKKKAEEDYIFLTKETVSEKACSSVITTNSVPLLSKDEENKGCQKEQLLKLETEKKENTAKSSFLANLRGTLKGLLSKDEENKGCQKEQLLKLETEKKENTAKSSFLANLRGTLKGLTRSDLEELIVQKLCEVITEKSTIGELRRKTQALEEDQEKWKAKAHSLSKQMREMEMVMKKYMNEVHKQIKDGNSQVVVPLRVTRSVGLQVSFFSNGNKCQKGNISKNATSSPAQNSIRSPKPSPSKIQNSVHVPNTRSKVMQANSKQAPASQKQRNTVSRLDGSGVSLIRPSPPKTIQNNIRTTGCEAQKSSLKPPTYQHQQSPQMQPQQQQLHQKQQFSSHQLVQQNLQQQQQQQLQNNSKVIDLTDDDDKQSVGAKPSGSIRVINHTTTPQISQNTNKLAYLLPPSTIASPNEQNKQVFIATPSLPQPNRNLMTMPPLLYKGGNPAAPGPQPPTVNQINNRVIFPKILRHPAPLPPQPVNQNNKPSLKLLPPRPALKISKVQTGIVLSWNMSLSPEHAPISSYQLYAYQESNSPPATNLWKKVGDVKALPLPMACTLTQFMAGHKYHFAVRAVDLHSRTGPFSFPGTIALVK